MRKRFKSWRHVVQRWGTDLLALPNEGTVVIKPNRHVPTRLAGLPSTIMSSIPPPEMTNKPASPSTLSKGEESTIPIDADIPDNYVSWTLKNQKALPPFQWNKILAELNWLNVSILTIPPLLTIYAVLCVPLQTKTFFFSIFYYFVTGLGELSSTPCSVSGSLTVSIGITAGYHRLWAHRAYNASKPLQYALAMAGAGAVEGSIKWWSRGHRAHHRYTDTGLDPYNAHQGFWFSHVGWMLVKPRRKPGVADISDLSKNEVVRWQHRWYLTLLLIFGFGVPTIIPGLLWGDWKGGYFFAGAARLVFVHHVRFFRIQSICRADQFVDSRPSVSIPSLTGSARLLSMISTHLAIT